MHAHTQAYTIHTLVGYMGVVGRTKDGFVVMPASKQKMCKGPPGWCCVLVVPETTEPVTTHWFLSVIECWVTCGFWAVLIGPWVIHGSWAVVVEPRKLDHLSWCSLSAWAMGLHVVLPWSRWTLCMSHVEHCWSSWVFGCLWICVFSPYFWEWKLTHQVVLI